MILCPPVATSEHQSVRNKCLHAELVKYFSLFKRSIIKYLTLSYARTFRGKIAAVHFCCPPQEKQARQPIELRHENKEKKTICERIHLLPRQERASKRPKVKLRQKNEFVAAEKVLQYTIHSHPRLLTDISDCSKIYFYELDFRTDR